MNRKLHMDSRDVEAKAPSIDPASEAKRLDAAVEEARIGIGYINVLTIANPLKFGTYNERPEKETETNKMVTSFNMHGIQSLKEANALCVIVKRSRLATGQTFAGQWTKEESLQEIQFNDNAEIVFASGQHRVAALKKMNKNTLDELSALVKRNTKLTELENPTEEQVEEQHEIREQIGEAKGKLKRLGKWGVILYDEGAFHLYSIFAIHARRDHVGHARVLDDLVPYAMQYETTPNMHNRICYAMSTTRTETMS